MHPNARKPVTQLQKEPEAPITDMAQTLTSPGVAGNNLTRLILAAGVSLLLIALVSCGGGSNDTESETEFARRVVATDSVYSVDDFLTTGFKQSKTYDVSELPGAVAAVYGFWQPPGDESVDYELRFYPSHGQAVADGTGLAEEVTGPDAAVTEDDSTWSEGVRDRRSSGFTSGGGGGSLAPKHGDFMIYGNVILLCQGRDSGQSLERCNALISRLPGRGAG